MQPRKASMDPIVFPPMLNTRDVGSPKRYAAATSMGVVGSDNITHATNPPNIPAAGGVRMSGAETGVK